MSCYLFPAKAALQLLPSAYLLDLVYNRNDTIGTISIFYLLIVFGHSNSSLSTSFIDKPSTTTTYDFATDGSHQVCISRSLAALFFLLLPAVASVWRLQASIMAGSGLIAREVWSSFPRHHKIAKLHHNSSFNQL